MDKLAKKVDCNHTLGEDFKQNQQLNKFCTTCEDYKELAMKLERMIDSLGYKSAAYIIDSRKMFR